MANNNNPFNLRYVLEKEKLSGTNFPDWEMNLKIVLECEKKLYVLTSEPPKAPEANALAAKITSYRNKLATGNLVGPHVLKMIGQIETLEKLDAPLHPMLAADLILGSLPAEYSQTVVNFYMNKLEMTMPELLKFLTTAEQSLGKGKGKSVLMVEGSIVAKKSGPHSPAGTKRKGSKKPNPASNSSSLKPKEGAKKKSVVCYYCGKKGHWRRNCAKLLAERKKGKKPQTSGKSIKTLRSDRGGEYLSLEFDDYLKEHGILSQHTPPGTPQLNGVSERRNRTLLDMVRSMISLTTLPESFWGYALKTAAHTLNRVPSKAVKSTPYELWHGRKPSFSYFKIWGCEAYVKRLLTSSKLEPKSDKVIFVGYPKETRGYEFYHPSDNKIFVARNGTFLEKEFLSAITSGRKSAKVCKLQHSIYGLKQASRSWYIRFDESISSFGFEKNSDESCVYKKVSGSVIVFLILYVNDILLMGNDIPALTSVKTWLSENFSMKDLGDASYVLGITIYRAR
ncbi:unnamed protein product [Cuscuta campestris]|uniref:Retrovirus-related Pol polyprotein from transposon TNT 1-94 n=1 Tax=Cuscuta campestris TaxID=132261 RepID=A0A484M8N7_9ASTE|nr:unnamed protein product [Cuscuta campestris]